jgi:hypothetical protein
MLIFRYRLSPETFGYTLVHKPDKKAAKFTLSCVELHYKQINVSNLRVAVSNYELQNSTSVCLFIYIVQYAVIHQ